MNRVGIRLSESLFLVVSITVVSCGWNTQNCHCGRPRLETMRHGCSVIIRKIVSDVKFMYLPSLTISWLISSTSLDSTIFLLLFFTSATYDTAESTDNLGRNVTQLNLG